MSLTPPGLITCFPTLLPSPARTASSATMRALGIAQEGDALLRVVAAPFVLPAEGAAARRAINELTLRAALVRAAHTFSEGMGLAAPQIGLGRRAAIVASPAAEGPIELLNPTVVEASEARDEPRYEGCLSFFDVRGRLTRPRHLRVAHQHADGTLVTTTFSGSVARLVAHEIDHLDGILYPDRMARGETPIPVGQYRRAAIRRGIRPASR